MASKKQRRRREKDRRHEYEYVYVDADGEEVAVDDIEAETPSKDGKTPSAKAVRTSGGRTIDPPSWRKTLRRGALFAPLMLLALYLLRPDGGSNGSVLVSTAMLLVFFIPFSYFMDSFMYRLAQKRAARGDGSSAKSR
jgi:hypothetical protein